MCALCICVHCVYVHVCMCMCMCEGFSSEGTYNQSNHPAIPVDQNVAYGMVERKGMDLEAFYIVN